MLPALLLALGRAGKEEAIDALGKAEPRLEASARVAIERAPAAMVRLVRESVEAAVKALEEKQTGVEPSERASLSVLDRMVRRMAVDPRNAREAADALRTVEGLLREMPVTKRLTNAALDVLEAKGFLGHDTLTRLVGALVVVGASGAARVSRFIQGGKVHLSFMGQDLDVDKTGSYAVHLSAHNPAWARQAVDLVIAGKADSSWFGPPGKGSLDSGLRASTVQVRTPITVGDPADMAPHLTVTPGAGYVEQDGEGRGRAELSATISRATPGLQASLTPRVAVEATGKGLQAVEAGVVGQVSADLGTGGAVVKVGPALSVRKERGEKADVDATMQATVRFGAEKERSGDGDALMGLGAAVVLFGLGARALLGRPPRRRTR